MGEGREDGTWVVEIGFVTACEENKSVLMEKGDKTGQ